MAEIQARALYDFIGDVQNGELGFRAGEQLTIVRQDIGEGWWEALNYQGSQGLIPTAYVEIFDLPEPSFPPPPPPAEPSAPPVDNGWNKQGGVPQQASVDEWDDDEWDDESSNSTEIPNQELQGQGNFGLNVAKREVRKLSPSDDSKYGTVKKNYGRFSTFVKAGCEDYLTGHNSTASVHISENEYIKIIESPNGIEWFPNPDPYTCTVSSPKKESKLKGLKSFIAYTLTLSFQNAPVTRRYKHFDWLHEQLQKKFPCMSIPPLPEKAISGRYEEDFITERMKFLQIWMNRMVRHPVIAKSDVFLHFLTCSDEKKWKDGKRKAEKDEYAGGKFFLTLQTPPHSLEIREVDKKMETFCKFVKCMDDDTRQLIAVTQDNRKKMMGPMKREYQKIGGAFKKLATTFNMVKSTPSGQELTGAIDHTADIYNTIGEMFASQPRNDLEPMMDTLFEYKGILSIYPDVLKLHEGAIGKVKETLKQQEEGKMTESDIQTVLQRADVMSYGTLAEMNHFHLGRIQDFKLLMQSYLRAQIEFYTNVTSKLQDALMKFDGQ
ncbi:hypothetical protein ScPMuIL_016056 [Solemya velum]